MKFYTYGSEKKPVIIMLPGPFCPAETLEYLYKDLEKDHFVILPEYNGHYEGSKDFTTRKKEVLVISQYLKDHHITEVEMIYGQSLGAGIGVELIAQLKRDKIKCLCAFFDGGPFTRLSKIHKMYMNYRANTMKNKMKGGDVEDVVNWSYLNKYTNGDPDALRPMLNSMQEISPILSEETFKNELESCYHFTFPYIDGDMQERMFFVYAEKEKAYKTSFKWLLDAYPAANFKTLEGYGHLTYSVRKTEDYLRVIRAICKKCRDM